ncbi:MAG: insulinase family protein [Alphaproteobacteria bacterium]|nr:insulinase family protein [Alphaproteobacteria bacterium]
MLSILSQFKAVITMKWVNSQDNGIKFIKKIFICLFLTSGAFPVKADVLPIQSFKTSSKLEVWLIEDHTSPIVSLAFIFDKEKSAPPFNPVTLLFQKVLDSGAGVLSPLEMDRFSNETPASTTLSIGISKNSLFIKTTKNGLPSTLKLWTRLLENPEFQKADLSYSKTRTLTFLSHFKEDLETIAYLSLMNVIFPDSSFNINFEKVAQAVGSLTAQDLENERTKQFVAQPKIVVVGDVTQKEITAFLDSTFGTLHFPPLSLHTSLTPQWGHKEVLIEKDVPQTVVAFCQPGVNPQSKEYPQYLLLQYVLTGRFNEELRVKRGLVYSIDFTESHFGAIDILTGGFSCECSNAQQVAKFVRSEWERIKDFGITQQELSNAKLSLERNKILRLTSTEAVVQEYEDPLAYNLKPDAALTLLERAEKTTLKEMNTFVQKTLKPDSLTFAFTGPSLNTSQSKGK